MFYDQVIVIHRFWVLLSSDSKNPSFQGIQVNIGHSIWEPDKGQAQTVRFIPNGTEDLCGCREEVEIKAQRGKVAPRGSDQRPPLPLLHPEA